MGSTPLAPCSHPRLLCNCSFVHVFSLTALLARQFTHQPTATELPGWVHCIVQCFAPAPVSQARACRRPLLKLTEVPLVLQLFSFAGLPHHRLLTPWHRCAADRPVPVSSPLSRAGAGAGARLSNALVKAPGFSEIVGLLTHRVSVDKSLPILSQLLQLERTQLEWTCCPWIEGDYLVHCLIVTSESKRRGCSQVCRNRLKQVCPWQVLDSMENLGEERAFFSFLPPGS